MTVKIKHIDGITNVYAKVIFGEKDINLEYKYQGMTWGRTIELQEAVKLGIIECSHPNMNPILGYENSLIGEICTCCNKEFFYSEASKITRHNSYYKVKGIS